MPKGLHQRPDRSQLVGDIRAATGGLQLPRKRHRCEIVLFGRWKKNSGDELARNTDNIVKTLMDAMSEAFGLGANGRGDQYLDRSYCVDTQESEHEFAEIAVTPL